MPALQWMLDTNALSDLIRNPQGLLAQRLGAVPEDALCTSVVVACELRFGAARKGSAVLVQRVAQLLDSMPVLALEGPADEHYADIRVALERAGTPIGSHDLFIAAHARSRELTLLTNNLREFQRVPGLRVESWLGKASQARGP
jgi:tRNA(fMet)-specific endonuclease VapC